MMIHHAWQTTKSIGRQCVQALPLVLGGIRAVRKTVYPSRVSGGLAEADLEHARTAPWKVFRNPMEVAKHEVLSTEDKKDILDSWANDATRLATAEGEGMGGGEPNRLSDVTEAKRKLAAVENEFRDEKPS